MKKILILSFCMLFLVSAGAHGQSRREEKAARKAAVGEQVKTLIGSGSFLIVFDRANPTGGRSVMLSPAYEMKFDSNRVSAYLPYFGRSYSPPANPARLAFELADRQVEPEISFDPRKGYTILFTATTESAETIKCYLKISLSGTASLSINSNFRSSISYLGNLKM
ncbi:MAG: DUF4251 domain-containing protein [Bacteroidales bacterium]|jgi:hypothetical protein|nr:DUF4251 domain-containing protein [Bacteroidales bacterium]MDD3943791.1 DUF4251 domain-containing protein [Bacteroidales bacterium]MDD5314198.1 DUF4251 domain-containing protein [Bacteroidales bacterium]MDY0359179.1 DUF4251 domain-containing protein [Bacteroidales bacterium]NLN37827.1 DUF4251 domain-containing protein [Bacteroidales bacterium]